jgi:hypothetical protein
MRVSRGLWQRVLPGVYLLQCGPPNPVQRALAAQVYGGEHAVVTGPAALRLHGVGDVVSGLWDDVDGWATWAASYARAPSAGEPQRAGSADGAGSDRAEDAAGPEAGLAATAFDLTPSARSSPAWRVHLLVPHGQRRQNVDFVRVSRTTRLPEPVLRYGVRLASPARATLDACSWSLEAPDEVTAAAFVETVVRAAVATGLADLGELEYELEQAPRRHTKALREALVRARAHERAAATRRLFEALGRNGPQGLIRRVAIHGERRQIAVAEALWPSRALVVTIDAKAGAVAELSRLGFAVIQVSAYELAKNTAGVLERIATALAARPEATLPRGVALLPVSQSEPDAAVEGGMPGRVQLALTSMPTLPQWSGLRVRGPAFSGAF